MDLKRKREDEASHPDLGKLKDRDSEGENGVKGGAGVIQGTEDDDGWPVFTVCGTSVTLKGMSKRKRRKHSPESLTAIAYKQQLTLLCKANDMVPALEVFDEMKAKGIKRDLFAYQVILAVCGGSPGDKDSLDPGNGFNAAAAAVTTSKDNGVVAVPETAEIVQGSAQRHVRAAADASLKIFADASNEEGLRLPESVFTGVIRACCLNGRVDKAKEVLEELKLAGEKPRLRSYTPLLEELSIMGRLQDSVDLWTDALSEGVSLTEREYLSLIKACTKACNKQCFLQVMDGYMEDVLIPRSHDSWDVLREWFVQDQTRQGEGQGGAPCSANPVRATECATEQNEKNTSVAEEGTMEGGGVSGGVTAGEALEEENIRWKLSECLVGTDGVCGGCGGVLCSIELSEDDEQRLLKQVDVLVCTNNQRTQQWGGFKAWVAERGKGAYDVIIDGANVGYYKQNTSEGDQLADLRQVDWVVRKYEAEGKKALVILHSRHLVDRKLPAKSKEILKRWRATNSIQSCAPRNNDDWYWLYAAVFMGGRVLVVTNDEMRDHHFSMLSHRSFQRWKERHQARFTLGEWRKDEDRRDVIVDEPACYSKRMQRSTKAWHFPLSGSEYWLCCYNKSQD